jgi:hypothetical protein
MVQWAEPKLTKDGRVRAPNILVGPHRVKGVPWMMYMGFGAAALYLAYGQYVKLSTVVPQKRFMEKIRIAPYGVLGTQLALTGTLRYVADEPNETIAIVDPAGLHHIKGSAAGAGGAAAAIYNTIGLTGAFPKDVVDSMHRAGDAKAHIYDGQPVIHAVGQDFREGKWSDRAASLELATAYRNVLHEFVMSEAKVLRVLPISGGIFAGPLYNQIPLLTQEALACGFDQLHPFDQKYINDPAKRIELCIFMEREWDSYCQVFDYLTPPSKL